MDSNDTPLRASFLASAPSLAQCPEITGAEVAFAGRSNVGKSSVLNRLTGHKGLARTSRTPGRTREINFFRLTGAHDGARLVDLPGYGYARAGGRDQAIWRQAADAYLRRRACLVGLILVTDIRHPGKSQDDALIRWAETSQMPLHILLNKADKLGFGAQKQALARCRADMGANPAVSAQLFSARTGLGLAQLRAVIVRLIQGAET